MNLTLTVLESSHDRARIKIADDRGTHFHLRFENQAGSPVAPDQGSAALGQKCGIPLIDEGFVRARDLARAEFARHSGPA